MGRIGPGEIALIAFIALLLFGAGRLSDIGKGLGEGIRNFKKGMRDIGNDDEPEPPRKQLPESTSSGYRDTTPKRESEHHV